MQPTIRLHGEATPPAFNLRAKRACPRCARLVDHYDIVTVEIGNAMNGKKKYRTFLQCPLCQKDVAETYPCNTCKKMVKDTTLKFETNKETQKQEFILICNTCKNELFRLPGVYVKQKI